MRPFATLLVLLAAGCASGAEFDRRAASYVGATEADLVSRLGVPSRSYETGDGRRFVQYDTWGAASTPAVVPSIGLGFGNFGWGSGWGIGTGLAFGGGYAATPTVACSLTFELRGGRVQGYERRGSDCTA